QIEQAIFSLAANARDAMPDGGTAVVESGLVDGRATIVVREQGPGLPEGLDVFQLFVTTKARGTGLGLPIAQQIVLEHGGDSTAESTPGQGAA
ncbi:ATP-binding protein, partial [Enterococcus casseliflavus]|uniref:ATP-binding protein n=1 Tax=Enterococcus casseliflavus TaxID=37734 RepID=UPI003D112CED